MHDHRLAANGALLVLAAALASPLDAQGLKPPTLLENAPAEPNELDIRTTPVVRAVQRAADSVVSIYVLDANAPRDDQAVEGQGSGVIVDESGLVITNWHVIGPVVLQPGRHRVQVRLRDERRFPAAVLSSSAEHDLALLQLELSGQRVQSVTAGRSEGLMIGETVLAIGNPEGQANTVTTGVLSAIDRAITVRAPDGQVRRYTGLLQTDAAINRGNSGGALLDITGKLVGINNAMAVGVENIGFAIPVDTVKRVFQDVLLSADNLASVWLGARVEDVDGIAVITAVAPASPAERAGLRRGDRLSKVRGQDVRSALDYARALATVRPGQDVLLSVTRNGERGLELSARAMSNAEREILARTGLELETVDEATDRETIRKATLLFHQGARRGRVPSLGTVLRVREAHPDSPAQDLGFQPGDVIVAARVPDFFGSRNVALRSLDEFADASRQLAGNRLFLVVMRDGEALEGELDVKRL